MNTQPDITIIRSIAQARVRPVMSILIPYYKDDPRPALAALMQQAGGRKDIEILIYDDGSAMPALNQSVCAEVKQADSPTALYVAGANRGRSFARNYLKDQARADWVLFLDADMRPDHPNFIQAYVDQIITGPADIIFGGFTVPDHTDDPDRELHRALSLVSDCLTLTERQAKGPQYVCSSNLCVKKSVIETEPFDPEFAGWGWEDSEWAARASQGYTLHHIDNPALHLGLETTDTLLRRFQTSGPNYKRFTDKHPDLARSLRLYGLTRKLAHIPGQKLMRPVLKLCVKLNRLPLRLRLLALKLWRASWYAESVS